MSEKLHAVVDSQLYETIQLCPQKYNLSFNFNIRPFKKKFALERGSVVHSFFEDYYLALKEGIEWEKALDIGVQAANKSAHETETLLSEEIEWEIEMLKRAAHFYRFDGWKPIEVEQPFLVQIYDSDDLAIYLAGKIDLVTDTTSLKNVPVDHKSYSRWMEPSKSTNQFIFYALATDSRYLIVNRIGTQKTLQDNERFRRVTLSYTREYLENEKKNIIWWVKQLQFHVETGTWPKNRSSCDKFGGCDFKPLCDAENESAFKWLMDTMFKKVEPWDVTKVLTEKANKVLGEKSESQTNDKVVA